MQINSNNLHLNKNKCSNNSFVNYASFGNKDLKTDEFDASSKKLINKFRLQGKISPFDFLALKKMLKSQDFNNENLKQLLNLINEKLLNPRCLKYISQTGELGQNIKNNVNKEYISQFDNIKNAMNNCAVGDIFKTSEENGLFIKVDEKKYNKIKMDENMFVELFPQMQKFASFQKNSSDCYLIATINAILDNPSTSYIIYDCLEQDGEDIKIKFPKGNYEYVYKNATPPKISSGLITGSKGIQLLEHAYGRYLDDLIMDKAIEKQKSLINEQEKLLNPIKNVADIKETRDKISKLQTLLNRLENDKAAKTRDIIVETDNYITPLFDEDTGVSVKSLNTLNTFSHSSYKSTADFYRNDKGFIEDVFNAFGLEKTNVYCFEENAELQEILTDPEKYSDYLIVGGTKKDGKRIPFRCETILDKEKKLFGCHAYRIIPFENDNGEILYKASNPWNSSHDLILTLEDLKNMFMEIDVAKII